MKIYYHSSTRGGKVIPSVQVKTAIEKRDHPEKFCPAKRCLWRTGGGYCPRHRHLAPAPTASTPQVMPLNDQYVIQFWTRRKESHILIMSRI